MKNLFSAAFIAAAAILLSGCTSGSKYVIEGSGDQLVDGHWMYVSDGVDWSMLDSALIENGSFRIEGTDMGSGVAMLYMGANSAPSSSLEPCRWSISRTMRCISRMEHP